MRNNRIDRQRIEQRKADALDSAEKNYQIIFEQYLEGNLNVTEMLWAINHWTRLQKESYNKNLMAMVSPDDIENAKKGMPYRKSA